MRLAGRCEELGYESWWAGEHVVLPSHASPPSPMDPTDPILDPLVHLAYVAAATERMLLGTGIIILPQRNPLVLAKQIATLDARQRRTLRVRHRRRLPRAGAQRHRRHARRAGQPHRRPPRRDARHLVRPGPVAFHGAHTNFDGLDANPRPRGTIPIVIGGTTPGAYRRAVEQGHGWYGFFLTGEGRRERRRTGRGAHRVRPRPRSSASWRSASPPTGRSTPSWSRAYAAAGVHRLIVYPLPLDDEGEIDHFLDQQAALVPTESGGKVLRTRRPGARRRAPPAHRTFALSGRPRLASRIPRGPDAHGIRSVRRSFRDHLPGVPVRRTRTLRRCADPLSHTAADLAGVDLRAGLTLQAGETRVPGARPCRRRMRVLGHASMR